MESFENEFEKLESALVQTGRSISYPATPPLLARVRPQLATPRRLTLRPAFVLAAIVIALALLFAFPEARDALAQIFGLRTIRILPVTPTPTTILASPTIDPSTGNSAARSPGAIATPLPSPTPRAQCCETTLAAARTRTRFAILLPPSDQPTRVYFQDLASFNGAQQLILVFGDPAAPRFRLYEATNFLYGKIVGRGTVVEELQVRGQPGLWLTGAPHLLVELDALGQPVFASQQTVSANTLAWESGDVTFRLETNASQADAIHFAESLR